MTRLVKLLCLGAGLGCAAAQTLLVVRAALGDDSSGPVLMAPDDDSPTSEEPGRVRISDLSSSSDLDSFEKFIPPAPSEYPDEVVDIIPPAPVTVPLPVPADTPLPAPMNPPSVPQPALPATQQPAEQKIEAPPILFRASDILRPDVLKGPNYEIAEKVKLEQYRFVFEIDTTWGKLEARGMPMLQVRLAEIRSIDRAKLIARDPQWIDGILYAFKMTPKGAYVAVTDPIGSARRLPRGLRRFAMTPFVEADQRAGSDVRRRLAVEIGCDPETSNPILSRLLDEMSLRKGIGSLAAQVGMNIAVPGLALLPVTGQFKETLAYKLPHEINADLDAELTKLGARPGLRAKFLQSQNFTTGERLVFLHYFRMLPGENKLALIEGAADISNEAEALSAIHELKMLLDASKSMRPLRYEYLGLPVAVLADGTNLIVTSADYINATPELEMMLATYRSDYPERPSVLYTSGRIAPDAQIVFRAAGIQLLQR